MREFHEQWARDNQAFIRKCEREDERAMRKKYNSWKYDHYSCDDNGNNHYGCDESSCTGHVGGGDCGGF